MSKTEKTFPRSRRSACADDSLRTEIERVKKMTMEERMRAALALGKGFTMKIDSSKSSSDHEK